MKKILCGILVLVAVLITVLIPSPGQSYDTAYCGHCTAKEKP